GISIRLMTARVIHDRSGQSRTISHLHFAPKATVTNQNVMRRFVPGATFGSKATKLENKSPFQIVLPYATRRSHRTIETSRPGHSRARGAGALPIRLPRPR